MRTNAPGKPHSTYISFVTDGNELHANSAETNGINDPDGNERFSTTRREEDTLPTTLTDF